MWPCTSSSRTAGWLLRSAVHCGRPCREMDEAVQMLWPSGLTPCMGTSLPPQTSAQIVRPLHDRLGLGAHCTVWRPLALRASCTLAASRTRSSAPPGLVCSGTRERLAAIPKALSGADESSSRQALLVCSRASRSRRVSWFSRLDCKTLRRVAIGCSSAADRLVSSMSC